MSPEDPPETLPYQEGRPIPPGYHVDTGWNKGLAVTGASLFGTAYLISLVASMIAMGDGGRDSSEFAPLLIPVIGPFITAGTAKDASFGDDDSRVVGTIMLLDGITQTAGAIMFVAGVLAENQVLLRNDLAETPSLAPKVMVGPRAVAFRWRF